MIAKSYIESTLHELDKLYNSSTSQKKAIYYSKLALLELCGWIEETVDDIVIKHANRHLKENLNKKDFKEKIVKNSFGFQYNKNIRPLLINLLGIIEVEKMEIDLERMGKISLLKGYLSNIKKARNDAAHTHLKGVTRRFNAPSRTLRDYQNICSILEIIDAKLRNN